MICLGHAVEAQLYINEWMASNSSIISDPEFDDSGDWIEIFNDYNDEVDISGFYLTDNLGSPTKWKFPEGSTIEANGFLLIWADGRDQGLHASFKLAKDGEEIGIYDTDTMLIDQITYSNQKTNISMGRSNDGSSNLGYFDEPTPGTTNSTLAYEGITFYEPHFSVTGGMYSEAFALELSTIDGHIRYTTDGSRPTLSSTLYTAPLDIDATTVIRAAVFQEDYIIGIPRTQTYFFEPTFAERKLPVVSITSDPKHFWDDSIGLYVQDFKPSWEYPINIELFENDGSDRAAFNELAGTRVNGLNSWVLPQKMLGIYFDNDYDKNNLDYQLFFERDRNSFDNFVLRASGSDWGNTLFRDALCQGLTEANMNIEHMAFRPSIVYINGEYMGIHNMRSRIDEDFIEENFGYTSTQYDLIENNGKVEEGDNVAFFELFDLLDSDMTVQANYDAVDAIMDIDNFTDYFITQIWAGNSSWGHNIQMWKPKEAGTKWRWILQDLDRGFTGIEDDLIHRYTNSTSPSGYNWARIPLKNLLLNEVYGRRFAQRFTDHLYTSFHPTTVVSAIQEHKDLIEHEIPYHVERWAGTTSSYGNGLPSVEYWEEEVSELIDYANGRNPILLADIRDRFGLEEVVDLTTICNPSTAGHITINELPITGSPWQGKYFENMSFTLQAKPNVGQQFLGWTTAQNELLIERASEWKYLDNGSDQGTAWREIGFDDTSWKSGTAKFGYGDGNENTAISFGGDPDNKFVTTYFRKSFNIDNAASYTGALTIELLRDDGAVIYLNGKELLRSNLPQGAIHSTTLASTFAAGAEETTFYSFLIQDGDLVQGKNTIAVEIHQSQTNSSDLGFDFSLKALKLGTGTYLSTEEAINVSLHSDSILVANYEPLADICTLPRRISSDMILELSCSPYFAISDVVVEDNATLTIEAGVEILFPENRNLEVHGSLLAMGSDEAKVHFSAIDEERPWGGIILHKTTAPSRLEYVEVSRASNGEHPIYENAAISAFHASVNMDHLTIIDVESNPILTYYSDVELHNSTLHSKVTGDLINVKYGNGIVTNTIFRGNDQIDTDAIDFDGVENGSISGNKISDFLGFNSDGIDIGEEALKVLIEGNFIHNCTDKGISVGQQSNIVARNNIIVNCDIGIAVKDQSNSAVDQNTFYNVGTPISCFEKNIGLGGGTSLVMNSILSNSSEQPILFDDVSDITIVNSLSDTDSLPTTMNLFGDPLFINPTFNDFNLQASSIALGSGMDEDGNAVDLGAHTQFFDDPPSLMINAIQYFPQGNPDAEFLTIYNPSDTDIDLQGYRIADAVDFEFPAGAVIEADESILVALDHSIVSQDIEKQYSWSRGRLSNEGENIMLIAPSGIIVDHVRYDNKEPWPLEAEGNGSYLKLISPSLDNHFAESWHSALNTSTENVSASDRGFQIYPNPTEEYLTITSEKHPIRKIEIFNTLGTKVLSTTSHSDTSTISIHALPSGLYFVRINGLGNGIPLVVK